MRLMAGANGANLDRKVAVIAGRELAVHQCARLIQTPASLLRTLRCDCALRPHFPTALPGLTGRQVPECAVAAPDRFIAWCKQEQASIEQQLELLRAGKVRTGEDIGAGWWLIRASGLVPICSLPRCGAGQVIIGRIHKRSHARRPGNCNGAETNGIGPPRRSHVRGSFDLFRGPRPRIRAL